MHQPHQLLRRLAEAGVDFVVVGGYAAVIHGSAYVTNDLDLCTVLSPDNLDRIRRALADLQPVHRQTHRRLSFLEVPPPGEAVARAAERRLSELPTAGLWDASRALALLRSPSPLPGGGEVGKKPGIIYFND